MVRCENCGVFLPRAEARQVSRRIRLRRRPVRKALTMDTQTQPAIPPFEQPSLPATINESGRRILWIVGIYRAVCGTLLVGIALFLDLRSAGMRLPNAFVTATGLYFMFGCSRSCGSSANR